jgi:hypothetical protein
MTSTKAVSATRILLLTVTLVTFELTAATAQQVPHLIYHPEPDTLVHAFRGKPFAMLYVEPLDSLPAVIQLYETLGRATSHARKPTESQQAELSRSYEAYELGNFHLAADIAGRVLALDLQIPAEDTIIRVDIYFAEAYSKLGALYLDYEQYDSAAFELTRALVAQLSYGRRGSPEFVSHQLSYLTEAYTELGLIQVARWFAGATLHIDPLNQYVLPYLERLGRGSEGILECTMAGDTGPKEGVYTLAARQTEGAQMLECLAPEEDVDGTLGPCLRIGRIFVGMDEDGVRKNIGIPARAIRTEAGRDAFVHLLFMNQCTEEGAYYVLEYEDVAGERVVYSAQLTGQRPPLPVSFSCLELGSPVEAVLRQLGPPTSVDTVSLQMLDVPLEVWNYDPHPISIEIVEGEVYSMKVWRSDQSPPLSRKPSLFYRP